jgi:hypothetical protein
VVKAPNGSALDGTRAKADRVFAGIAIYGRVVNDA